jgi:hypothetical protein
MKPTDACDSIADADGERNMNPNATVAENHSMNHKPWWESVSAGSMSPLFVGTDSIYPFRTLLATPEQDAEIRSVIHSRTEGVLRDSYAMSFMKLANGILDDLCGPEPLTTYQLVAFINAFAFVVRRTLTSLVGNRRMPGTGTTIAASSSCGTAVPDGGAEDDKHDPITGLTLVAARTDPDLVEKKLLALDILEKNNPTAARWLQLVELTGATVDELARYFSIPRREIESTVGYAISEVMKVAR